MVTSKRTSRGLLGLSRGETLTLRPRYFCLASYSPFSLLTLMPGWSLLFPPDGLMFLPPPLVDPLRPPFSSGMSAFMYFCKGLTSGFLVKELKISLQSLSLILLEKVCTNYLNCTLSILGKLWFNTFATRLLNRL